MVDAIAPIGTAIPPIRPLVGVTGTDPAVSFAATLRDAVAEVAHTQQSAETAAEQFASGRTSDVAGTMIAVERASVTLQLMLQIRNRLLEAYQEIQRLQV